MNSSESLQGVAIIGMSCRFPGANNVEAFWQNLIQGVHSISFFTDQELAESGLTPEQWNAPNYVRAAGILDDIETFDASFFGYTPLEAELLCPQHRLFLECAWEAIEGAGYDPERYPNPIGVFAGASLSRYMLGNVFSNLDLVQSVGDYQIGLGANHDFLATRVSYKLNLKGPSMTVQTACSTSLVATTLACQSLMTYQCDMALAGGASIYVPQKSGYFYQEGSILSPTGYCRPFDAQARGTVGGNGVGVVLLKRLEDALQDGDTIHAVIRGWAVNNDGALKVGFTAPSVVGQAEVIATAQMLAGVEPHTITYVETHGTGTVLGDPIEIAALSQVFRAGTNKKGFCAIGSVKSNFGHLDSAAGAAGLIKTTLALKHKQIPPSLHFEQPNPKIDFDNSPFYVNTHLTDWQSGEMPRRAGLSSFGIGGTNVHLVLEEAPAMEDHRTDKDWHLLTLSAKTDSALNTAAARLADHLKRQPELDLADVAYTLQTGRRNFKRRLALVCQNTQAAIEALEAMDGRVLTSSQEPLDSPVVFLFTGQGSQYVNMGLGLYQSEVVFRQQVDACAQILEPHLGLDLRTILYPPEEQAQQAVQQLAQTGLTQPALFVIEYALAQLWMSWGIKPHAMVGHSIGEYVAACLSGVFSLEDALELVATRGRLMQSLPGGAMLAVPLPEEKVLPLLGEDLSVAAINAPASCVVSGNDQAVDELERRLNQDGLDCRRLHTSHAFHSPMMEPILDTFADQVELANPQPPQIPYLSNVSGTWITVEEATDPDYWANHLRRTVRFSDQVRELIKNPAWVLLEVGPAQTLGQLVKQHLDANSEQIVLSSLRHPKDPRHDMEVLLGVLGQLWLAGSSVDWTGLYSDQHRRVLLPTYPFERQRYWIPAQNWLAQAYGQQAGKGEAPTVPDFGAERAASQPRPSGDQLAQVPVTGARPARARHARPALKTPYVAPSGEIESKIALVWQELFGIEQVGVHDNFYELGGHSLLATQIVSRLREALTPALPVRAIFEAPTIADLARQVETILGQSGAAPQAAAATPITPAPRDRAIPLSFSQQRLWYLDQLFPGATHYNLPTAVRLDGELDLPCLKRALGMLIERHESLRTTFKTETGQSFQVIAPELRLDLPLVDLCHVPTARREGELTAQTTLALRQPFDLERGPLLRFIVLKLDETQHVLFLVLHHIISDGWSQGVLLQELLTFYGTLVAGVSPQLPELPIQYADFAVWQREWLQGEVMEAQLDYWKQQLKGAPAMLDLHTDFPWPSKPSFLAGGQSFVLPPSVVKPLQALGEQHNATLFMTVLAALEILLYRLTGQEDIVVGTPIAGRSRPEIEGLIGFFLNTLVLRTDLSGQPTFRQALERVRQVTLGAYAHQDLPFEMLVDELQPERDLHHGALFDILVNFVSVAQADSNVAGLTISPVETYESEARFLMTIYLGERPGHELSVQIVYRSDLFCAERIAHILDQFQHLLDQVVANPDAMIQSYSLATPRSRRWLPDPTLALPERRYALVTERFLHVARCLPGQPAISQADRVWSYGELLDQAQAVAHALLNKGLERRDVVAVMGRPSFGLIASMLGVFFSSGVLLTLDPNLPVNRRRMMLQQAQARYLLYVDQAQLSADEANELSGPEVIHINPGQGLVGTTPGGASEAKALPVIQPDDAAYLFFTSGTTGAPKGVLGCHKGLAHFLTWQRETFGIGPQTRSAQLTALSFDVVLRDIFTPLTSGATLCLPEGISVAEAERILPWLEQEKISMLHIVPALAQAWLSRPLPEPVSLQALRWVFFAGEPLADTLVRRWRAAFPQSGHIVNLYGPTETTLAKCFHVIPVEPWPGVQPIGRPLPETQALILTADNRLCGLGEPGEIVIRTPFRSLGYLNAPSEGKFFKNPFRDDEQDVLYRSGDLGRYRYDGLIEIVGRVDHQVKIRGLRIEPDEITAVLAQHPAVKACIVTPYKDAGADGAGGDYCLAAYLVPTDRKSVTIPELRVHLSRQLPPAMIPSAFVFLEALPLMPNGKVDRAALPAPQSQPIAPVESAPPRTPLEKTLVEIWKEALQVEQVGIHDNFFDLGGNSLLSLQIVARAVRSGLDLSPQQFMEYQTIAELAAAVEGAPAGPALQPYGQTGAMSNLVQIQAGAAKPPIFFVHPATGEVWGYMTLARLLGSDYPFYGLEASGLRRSEAWHTDIESMAAYYLEAVRSVQPHGPYYLGGWSMGGTLAFEMATQLRQQGQAVAFLAMIDSGRRSEVDLFVGGLVTSNKNLTPLYKANPRLFRAFSGAAWRVFKPGLADRSRRGDQMAILMNLLRFFELANQVELGLTAETLRSQSVDQQFQHILDRLKQANIESPEQQLAALRRRMDLTLSNADAIARYKPKVYPGKVTYFKARDAAPAQADISALEGPARGWEKCCETIDIHVIPGYHDALLEEPHVSTLAQELRTCLEQVE